MTEKTAKGFTLIEILVTVCLTALIFIMFHNWYGNYMQTIQKETQYYRDRNELINRAERAEGTEQLLTKNIYVKNVTVNNLSLEYLINK